MIAEQICRYSLEFADGNYEEIIKILESQGKIVTKNGPLLTVKFPDNYHATIPIGASPVDLVPALMFALFGPMWAIMAGEEYGKAQKLITKEIRKRRLDKSKK